ncbi:MAG: hypothetical protein ACREKM_06155 [Longimicrobiales bacterium]
MTRRTALRFAAICFALYALAVTWPGALQFADARPFVLGLPFNFFWIILWIVIGGIALAALELSRPRGER